MLLAWYIRYCTVPYIRYMQYGTVQYSTVQYSTVRYSMVQYSTHILRAHAGVLRIRVGVRARVRVRVVPAADEGYEAALMITPPPHAHARRCRQTAG